MVFYFCRRRNKRFTPLPLLPSIINYTQINHVPFANVAIQIWRSPIYWYWTCSLSDINIFLNSNWTEHFACPIPPLETGGLLKSLMENEVINNSHIHCHHKRAELERVAESTIIIMCTDYRLWPIHWIIDANPKRINASLNLWMHTPHVYVIGT